MADVIDVWDMRTFDPAVLGILEERAQQIVTYFATEQAIFLSCDNARSLQHPVTRPDNPCAYSYHALLDEVAELMASRAIRAFHYTRLTDDEVAALRRSGIHLSTMESLRRRLGALVGSGAISAEIGAHLYQASPFHGGQHDARSGKFWMVSHPLAVDDGGVAPLLKRWGGEVASFWVDDPALLKPLVRLGKARILEIAAPLASTPHSHAASKAVVATFGRSCGAIPEKSNFDLYVEAPLPPAAVLAIHTEDEVAFTAMGRSYPAGYFDVDVGLHS